MSLVNENDIVIPGTVGTISAAAREANYYYNKARLNGEKEKEKAIASCIRDESKRYEIYKGRIEGIPLENLISPKRIANNKTRIKDNPIISENNDSREQRRETAYESWFRE